MTTLDDQPDRPRYQLVIDGRRVEAASGQRYNASTPTSARRGPGGGRRRRRGRRRRGGGGPPGAGRAVGPADRVRPGPADAPTRGPDRAGRRPARRDRDPRHRQAAARDARATGQRPGWYYYFSGLADKLEGSTIPVDKPNFLVYSRREPDGVVGAIAPWNYPLLLRAGSPRRPWPRAARWWPSRAASPPPRRSSSRC